MTNEENTDQWKENFEEIINTGVEKILNETKDLLEEICSELKSSDKKMFRKIESELKRMERKLISNIQDSPKKVYKKIDRL